MKTSNHDVWLLRAHKAMDNAGLPNSFKYMNEHRRKIKAALPKISYQKTSQFKAAVSLHQAVEDVFVLLMRPYIKAWWYWAEPPVLRVQSSDGQFTKLEYRKNEPKLDEQTIRKHIRSLMSTNPKVIVFDGGELANHQIKAIKKIFSKSYIRFLQKDPVTVHGNQKLDILTDVNYKSQDDLDLYQPDWWAGTVVFFNYFNQHAGYDYLFYDHPDDDTTYGFFILLLRDILNATRS